MFYCEGSSVFVLGQVHPRGKLIPTVGEGTATNWALVLDCKLDDLIDMFVGISRT